MAPLFKNRLKGLSHRFNSIEDSSGWLVSRMRLILFPRKNLKGSYIS